MKKILLAATILFSSCAFHQDLYKQPGYWTYEGKHYRFHPAGTWQLIQPQTIVDSSKLFYRVKSVTCKGAEHINYVNN